MPPVVLNDWAAKQREGGRDGWRMGAVKEGGVGRARQVINGGKERGGERNTKKQKQKRQVNNWY